MMTRFLLILAAAISFAFPVIGAAADANAPAQTARLISVLNSDAPFFEKARACQQLGEVGTPEAVPALADLLADPKLSAYARSGLERIPSPGSAAALREAAATLKGPLVVGVIDSLAAIRDPNAVELLTRLATDAGPEEVSKAALMALGNIASAEAIWFLRQKLETAPEALRPNAAAACLLAADRARAAGTLADATALYDAICKASVPTAYRVGATRGAILARTTDRVPFLLEQLRSAELAIRNAALLTIREIPDDTLAEVLNAELARATPELQSQLLLALADCHNSKSAAGVEKLAGSSDADLRKTALKALGRLGPSAAPALLGALQREPTAEDRAIILDGLKTMSGPAVDEHLLQALTSAAAPRARLDIIRLLDARGVSKASGQLVKLAAAPDREVSIAALSALKSLAAPAEVPGLIALVKACSDDSVRDAAENALAGACTRPPGSNTGAEAVLAELKSPGNPAQRNSWVRILANIGYAKALPLIEAAANDSEASVADNALAQLGRWPDPAPMETLLKTMDAGATEALRKRALSSVVDIAATATDEAQAPEGAIVQWLRRADSAAQSAADHRRILGVLGRLKTTESFRLFASHLDNPDLRTEAASGIVQIAPALAGTPEADAVKLSLEKIARTVGNDDLRKRAQALAKTVAAQSPQGALFDGRSLSGWQGDTNVWRVREGVIVGGSLQGNRQNEFLATTRSYANFALRLEYKLVGTEGFVNGGVQFRSVRVANPPNEMSGYQADIGAGYSGCLYDESRRNKFLVQSPAEVIKRLEKAGDWNRYEVRCEGPHIQIWLNGEKTVDYAETDGSIPQQGLVALQIHGGSKAEVAFRNITLQEL